MEAKRTKELMAKLGMPNSTSLMTLIEQVVNETEQVWNYEECYAMCYLSRRK